MSEQDPTPGGPGAQWDLSFLDPVGGTPERGLPAADPVVASDLARFDRAVTGGWSGEQDSGGPTHGLNVVVCQDISYELTYDARTLAEVIEDVDFSVRKIRDEWHGPDAESWQAKWSTQRRRLTEAAEGLTAMRRRLDIDIDEQQRTSRI